jgi:hypothetical protein
LPDRLRSDRVLLRVSASFAFGVRSNGLLSEISRFISTKDRENRSWYDHRVYAVQKAYVGHLLVVDVLLAPLCPDAFIYQRDVRMMSLEQMTDGWSALTTAIASVADARR